MRDGFLSSDLLTKKNAFGKLSIFVYKTDFADYAFTFCSFCQVNKLLDITSRLTVGVHEEWAVNGVSTILDGLYGGLNAVNRYGLN